MSTTPYFIMYTNDAPVMLAGIWDIWESPYPEDFESGAIGISMSVVTTPPGRYMAKFHDSSPLILEGESALAWMQPGMQADDVRALFKPYESENLEAFTSIGTLFKGRDEFLADLPQRRSL